MLNGVVAVVCMVLLGYAGVVMLYVSRHDGLPPPFPRRLRKFDRTGDGDQPDEAVRDRRDP